MSLTQCRFFAQGSCRYGNSCRFYHEPRGQQQAGFFGNRGLAPATFQPAGGVGFAQGQGALNLTQKSSQNLDIIIEGVKKDIQEWQICKIWPYSCYGPVGGKSCMPGFEDLSPDEFRLAFMQHGNVVPPEVGQRFQQIQQLRVNYLQPTMENRAIIERIVTANTGTSTVFGGGQETATVSQSSIFGGATNNQTAGSIFGGTGAGGGFSSQQQQPSQQQASSIFGGSSTFGPATTSTFGQSNANLFQSQQQPTQSAGGIFGGQQQQQVQGQSAGFGLTSPQQQSASIFQNPLQQQPTGIFQNQAPGASGTFQTTSSSIFQQQQPQQPASQVQGSFFSQPQPQPSTTGLFQVSQPQTTTPTASATGLFTQPQQTSLFSQTATAVSGGGSIFGGGNQSQSSAPAPAAGNIFGGAAPVAATAQPVSSNVGIQLQSTQLPSSNQKFVYSQESDLSPEELQAFKDGDFSIDSLPTKMPPQSLCL